MEKQELINSLEDLRNNLDKGKFKYCNLTINEMSIFACPELKVTTDGFLFLYSGTTTDTTIVIKLDLIKYLHAFAITSGNKEVEEVIDYGCIKD